MPKHLKICLTGGGTAGHVTPHFALLEDFKAKGWDVFYLGSAGLEMPLVKAQGLDFYPIAAGKLRRYLSVKNVSDIFRVLWGFFQAWSLLGRLRPDVVFSKGGFVAVPVAVAAWARGIPVISHESDVSPGLANRIISRFARKILYSFPETKTYLGTIASEYVGAPVRPELLTGDAERGALLCRFTNGPILTEANSRSTILVMGGSQGAQRINEALRSILPELVTDYRVIHLTGKGKQINFTHPNYAAFEFVSQEFKDLLALSTHVVSRAGANSIFELLAVQRPMLLIPLMIGSRGDQILNAASFAKEGWAKVLPESNLTPLSLLAEIRTLVNEGPRIIQAQERRQIGNPRERIVAAIASVVDGPILT